MNRLQPVVIAFFLLIQGVDCAVFFNKEWTFESSRTVSFVVTDTCEIRVEFMDKIPPDFLVGYTRLGVQIDDSLAETPDSVRPLLRMRLDAGFLNFSHVLTVTFNVRSGLFQTAGPVSSVRCMKDPFPMAKVHFWIHCDSVFFDDDEKIVGFAYRHVAPNSALSKTGKTAIATADYPFNFGIMCMKNARVARPMRVKGNCEAAVSTALTIYGFTGRNGFRRPMEEYSLLGRALFRKSGSARSLVVIQVSGK